MEEPCLMPEITFKINKDNIILSDFEKDFIIERNTDNVNIIKELKNGSAKKDLEEKYGLKNSSEALEELRNKNLLYDKSKMPEKFNEDVFKRISILSEKPEDAFLQAKNTKVAVKGNKEGLKDLIRRYGFEISDAEECDVILVLKDEFTEEIENLAQKYPSKSLIPVRGSRELFIGPFISEDTVCIDCYRRRRLSNLENPHQHAEIKKVKKKESTERNEFRNLNAIKFLLRGITGTKKEKFTILKGKTKNYSLKKHLLLPSPRCKCKKNIHNDFKTEIRDFVSSTSGLVTSVNDRTEESDFENFYLKQAISSNKRFISESQEEVSSGGFGISQNPEEAHIKAIAEALERYALSIYSEEDLKRSKRVNIGKSIFNQSYNERQYKKESFPYKKLSEDDEIAWTKVQRYKDKEEFYAPAYQIYQPFDGKNYEEIISTGAAIHQTELKAIKEGILEIIERDAITITFLNKLNTPQISDKALREIAPVHMEALDENNITPLVMDITTDIGVPCYFAFGIDDKNQISSGAGCALNPKEAVQTALEESMATYHHLDYLDWEPITSPSDINQIDEHVLYYQGENRRIIEEWRENMESKDQLRDISTEFTSTKQEVDELVKRLNEQNMEIYFKNITPEDIRTSNLEAIRAICPSAADLNVDYKCRKLGAERIFEVPEKLGYSKRGRDELNSDPHPMP